MRLKSSRMLNESNILQGTAKEQRPNTVLQASRRHSRMRLERAQSALSAARYIRPAQRHQSARLRGEQFL